LGSLSRGTRRRIGIGAAGVLAVVTSMGVGYVAAGRARPSEVAHRAWHGKVAKIAHAGGGDGGVTLRGPGGERSGAEGVEVGEGTAIVTDERTRVRLELDDGSSITLDRSTDVTVETSPRTLRVAKGSLVADVAHVDGASDAHLVTATAELGVLGTKFAMTHADDRTTVEVLRGLVELRGSNADVVRVAAGEEGVASRGVNVEIAPVNDLAQRLAFGERLGLASVHNEDTDLPVSGLGELRARRPGRTDEKDHAVRLASHDAKVRIVGSIARTEIDETFANETGDDLEGVYRFPLPPGAQIERLALEVDGKLVDGAFVDKQKGAAIFRGAIHNATPAAPKPKEEIIWVPGPWRDPALLEWQRGGRFELRIFPIPKHGSRRVVIAYTETVAPVAGLRRYVYPLPQATSSELKIGHFGLDVQVLGNDPKAGVKAKGYELAHAAAGEGGAERFTQSAVDFIPTGDLTVEYALADRATDVTAWGFRETAPAKAAANTARGPAGLPVASAAAGALDLDKGYVALALRPKLPGWTEARARDVVVVVDAGRTMFGERFQRAKRLAVQFAQEMDRRDRLAVLACDVACRAMAGGFAGAGSAAAHDADAFLAQVEPDGASDLVGAVRAAEGVAGHDRARDLRVVLISDGIATAGYRRVERLASEVHDALASPGDEIIVAPIGSDADTTALAEIARGGGGAVVPYAPGEMLETAALDVLNATYGITLRDVEVTLPPGLTDVAPAALAPIRAGGEAIVAARVGDARVVGDVVLRGKVGGQPFEARYPIDVAATTDAGNAFVPRLYAAARIADRERLGGADSRTELVSLSQRYHVPSRFTSLLVLESEAMFRAFGIERDEGATAWTGEAAAHASETATVARADDLDVTGGDGLGAFGTTALDEQDDKAPAAKKKADTEAEKSEKDSRRAGPLGGFAGGGRASEPPPAPAQKPSPSTPAAAPTSAPSLDRADPFDGATSSNARQRQAPGRWMKRVWTRRANIVAPPPLAVDAARLAAARAALQAAPDERAKYKDLVRALSANGAVDELGEVLARWSSRDPMDADAIAARADLAARGGDRERALRIVDGVAAGGDPLVLEALAAAHERAGDAIPACAFRVAAAEVRSDASRVADPVAVGRAVACERAAGRGAAADRWLDGRKDRDAIQTAAQKHEALAKGAAAPAEAASSGDIVVDATWDAASNADLDVAVVDPSGNRVGWAGRSRAVRVSDPTSRRRETLAITSGAVGAFTVEIARASGGNAPISGSLLVRARDRTMTVPFTLSGPSAPVARVQMRLESELVPADGPTESFAPAPPFNRGAAQNALAAVSVVGCAGASGVTGNGTVRVTFAPSGRIVSASVDSPFAGTSTGACVVNAYRRVLIPAFDPSTSAVTITKGFVVPP